MSETRAHGAGEAELDAALAEARSAASPEAPLPPSLQARLLADAEALRPEPARAPVPVAPGRWRRLGATLFPAAGWNWGAAGGLAACAASGLWLGYAPPLALRPAVDDLYAALAGASAGLTPADLLAPLDGDVPDV